MKRHDHLFERIIALENLFQAAHKAQQRKRARPDVARFNLRLESELLKLQNALSHSTWTPAGYRQFWVREPKPRLISAAPYRDRVAHHALCNVIEPLFEPTFIHDSYACRVGKGIHRALNRCTECARRYRYVLKADIRRFFPSIDHAILLAQIGRRIKDNRVITMIEQILASSPEDADTPPEYYPGDDLFTPLERRKGLPIGNLTSQFFANVYLNGMDHFVKRELKIKGYIRYCDDFLLFDDDKARLRAARLALDEYLISLRIRLHPIKTRVFPVSEGIGFLGFRVFREYRRLDRGNVLRFKRRLRAMRRAYAEGRLSLAEVEQRIQSWIAHAGHGDTWRLREAILSDTVFSRSL